MVISNIKECELWYRTECGFKFPVPISEDAGNTTFLVEDRAMLFMRYIKKQIVAVKAEAEVSA